MVRFLFISLFLLSLLLTSCAPVIFPSGLKSTADAGTNSGSGSGSGTGSGTTVPRTPSLQLVSVPSTPITYYCNQFTVTALDANGTPTNVASNLSVSLSGLGSGSAYWTLSDCQNGINSQTTVFIATGTSSATFYYRNNTSESINITVSANGYSNGTVSSTINLVNLIGQSSPTANKRIQNGMYGPSQISICGTKMFVADYYNNRVLGWNSIPTATSTTTSPDVVLGQPDFYITDQIYFGGYVPMGTTNVFNNPNGVFCDGTRLYIADSFNNRVQIWNTIPTVSNTSADIILNTVGSGCTSVQMNNPTGIYSDGTKLYVADSGNNRVLVWNSIPAANDTAANFALGQPNLTSNTSNNGGVGAGTLSNPTSIYKYGTQLFVTDGGNHRVLVWNAIPTTNGAAASFAVGQPNFTTITSGYSNHEFFGPTSVYTDGTKLFVADPGNDRVMIWNTLPSASGSSADLEVGQPGFDTRGAYLGTVSSVSLASPNGIAFTGTKLLATSSGENRILVWNTIPTATNQAGDYVIGQADINTGGRNAGTDGVTLATVTGPSQSYTDGTRFFVADTLNNRVLIWNSIPTSNFVPADVVLGQTTSSSVYTSNSSPSATNMYGPSDVVYTGTKLYVVDQLNHRVLGWNSLPTVNGQAANFALGQPDLVSNTSNNGGTTGSSLSWPTGVAFSGTRLFVADKNNSRVLVWNTLPSASGTAANIAIGRPNLTTGTSGTTSTTMNNPVDVECDGTKVYVADQSNHRVLIYNTIPGASGAAANVVLGQTLFTNGNSNNGGGSGSPQNFTLYYPSAVHVRGTKLFVADNLNQRIMYWSTIPSSNGTVATSAFGQSSLTVNTRNAGGLSSTSLYNPGGVTSDPTRLFVTDTGNSRILIFNLP